MNCERVQIELDSFLRGETPADLAGGIRSHLGGCAECRDEATFAQELGVALGKTRAALPSADTIADRVLAGAPSPVASGDVGSRRRRGRRRPRVSPSVPWPVFVALAAAVLVAISVVFRGGGKTESTRDGVAERGEDEPVERRLTQTAEDAGAEARPMPFGSETETGTEDEPGPEAETERDLDPVTQPVPETRPQTGRDPEAEEESKPTPRPEPRPEAPPLTAAREGLGAVALWVDVTDRRADVQGADATWRPLAADIAVRPGERIRTGKGVVTLAAAPLTVGEDPRAAFTAAALPATRVALGPGTVVQLTKRESALALERGECFASVDNTLAILLPAGRVEIYSGEVGVAVGYSGRVQVAALTGNASLFLPAGRVDLDPGQRVSVDRKGRAGRARKGAKTPRWTRGLRKAEQVLYLEAFNAWNPTYMSPQGALQRGVAISERTGNESVVRFGRSEDTGGLFRHEGPLRIRVRYRLSDAAPITLQIMNHTQRDNYHTVLRAPRVGLWTDAVFRVERFEDNEKRGKKPRDGDLWGYVALRTPAARLEVDEVSLYRIR